MARELVAVKVKIGLTSNNRAKYPAFHQLASVITSGMNWSHYVDAYGLGWQYDKTSGHQDDTPSSPVGQQWGVLVVPEVFGDEAVAAFPVECEFLTEIELEEFYDDKAHEEDQDEELDLQILQTIRLKQELGLVLTVDQLDAIDPLTDKRGVRKNKNKKWVDYKQKKNVNIKDKS